MTLSSWHEGAAILFLLSVVIWPLILAWSYSRRSDFSFVQVLFVFLAMLFAYCLWRGRRRHQSRRPIKGGGIILCNHRSSVDPFFIQVSLDRPVYWMVAREYCEKPLLAFLLSPVPIIPTSRRGADSGAIRMAIEKARQGFLVGIFPEGRINTTTDFMISVRPGAMMIAQRAGVQVIPMFLEGSPYRGSMLSAFSMTADVRTVIGDPYRLEDVSGFGNASTGKEQQALLMLDAINRIAKLAGVEGFIPRLAGRKWAEED